MKDLWTGKSSLNSAMVLLLAGGLLVWVISGLAAVDFVGPDSSDAPLIVVMGVRGAFLTFACVAVWRCARNSAPASKRQARLVVVLVAVMYLVFAAAVLPSIVH